MGWGEFNDFSRSKEAIEKDAAERRIKKEHKAAIAAKHVAAVSGRPERQDMPFVNDVIHEARAAGKNVEFDGFDGEIIRVDGKEGIIGVDDRVRWL